MTISMRFLLAILLSTLLSAAGWAMPSMTVDIVGGPAAEDLTSDGTFTGPNSDGIVSWELNDTPVSIQGGLGRINSWTAQMKDDPFVTNNINVTNTSSAEQVFIATVLLPITAFNYNALSGSMGVSVTDSDSNNGVSLDRDDPISIYEADIDGALALALDFDDLPITEADCSPFPFDGCSADAAKNQPQIAAGPGTANDIALTLRFALSPGDSAGFTSRFEVVPEPTTALLLGLGLGGLAVASRRRR